MEHSLQHEGDLKVSEPESAALAELRHAFRNQIQSMTSLVGLFGDRMEPGPARAAFLDLRARLEATMVMHADEFENAGQVRCDAMLAALARRIAALYAPGGGPALEIATTSFMADARRAATIAQLFAEMLIEFFRSQGSERQGGVATAVIGGTSLGGLSLRISDGLPAPVAVVDDISELGRIILQSLAQSLGGEVLRDASEGFAIVVEAPGSAEAG